VRIPLPDYLLKLRRDAVEEIGGLSAERVGMRGWRIAMSSAKLYRASAQAARIGTRLIGRGGRIRRLPPPLHQWTHGRDFPPFAKESFRERWYQGNRGSCSDAAHDAV
jgi:L-lactate dehydrogenase complex protein LldF